MHKFKKESLLDWAAYINGQYFAMITKLGKQQFQVKFKGYEPQSGFASFEEAKFFVRLYKFKGEL